MRPQQVETGTNAQGQRLRLVFQWGGDRYHGRLLLIDPLSGQRPLCHSVEGGPDTRWPPSPPWQQLMLEQAGDGNTLALALGMAGSSHWSASIQPDPAEPCITWDVACRVRQPPEFLGSRFAHLPPQTGDCSPAALQLILLETPDQPSPSHRREGSETLICATPSGPLASLPGTIRWRFSWLLNSGGS